uniref:Uncharacterized protein n=1 Tax=Spermophilus dauricus TaxID=99837 RepID=A0A8C9Q0I5_SPEDA
MVTLAHYDMKRPIPQPHLLQRSLPGKCSIVQPGEWMACARCHTGISLSKKAESQENSSPSARTSAPRFWGNSGWGSARSVAV